MNYNSRSGSSRKKLVVVLVLRIRFDYGMILTNPDQKFRIKCKLILTILVTLSPKIWNLVAVPFFGAVPKVRSEEKPRSKIRSGSSSVLTDWNQ
jgi:hypothetical protein